MQILKAAGRFPKFQQIIQAPGGNPDVDSEKLIPGKFMFERKADKKGTLKQLDIKNITAIAKILGAPKQKGSGIYLIRKSAIKSPKTKRSIHFFPKMCIILRKERTR